jgi:hypothetical protein
MRRFTLFRWAAALTLAIALLPSTASAQEDGTLTISGLFSMGSLYGTVGPDLAEVFANGHEHTWTLTLHGASQLYYYWDGFTTQIHATSFDLEFFGPDAATLNDIVREHIAGEEAVIDLTNFYWGDWGDFASIRVLVWSPEVVFQAGDFEQKSDTLFPSDEYGYPVVGQEPFSIWVETIYLGDYRPGNDGVIGSLDSLVTLELGSACGTFVAPDLDHDCDVDTADVAAFKVCASREGVPVTPACQSSDFDGDGDADMTDFGILQRCYENAVPTCMN